MDIPSAVAVFEEGLMRNLFFKLAERKDFVSAV